MAPDRRHVRPGSPSREAADKIERGEPVGDTLGCIADDLFGYDAADAFRDFDVWTRTIG